MRGSAIYIAYDGMLEALGRSQVSVAPMRWGQRLPAADRPSAHPVATFL